VKKKQWTTADGVPVRKGMVLFMRIPPGLGVLAHCEKVARVDEKGAWSAYAATVFPRGLMDLGILYSTYAAAAPTPRPRRKTR
jgi:hypothetical protein